VDKKVNGETASPPRYRTAGADDVHAIVALVQSAYRGEASRAGWTTEADLLDGQRTDADAVVALIQAPASRILLCEQDGALLASAQLEKHDATCHFGMFAVHPERQGGGLGQAMLAEAERIARDDWACLEMQMAVITQRTELIAWYERRGYHRTGIYQPFPYGDARFGLPKRDDLRLEVLRKPLR
jgi:ribosomal protein S18 acetylase RimI-like enzyme